MTDESTEKAPERVTAGERLIVIEIQSDRVTIKRNDSASVFEFKEILLELLQMIQKGAQRGNPQVVS